MDNGIADGFLLVLFLGVIAVIPVAWWALGQISYGSGDYRQP